MRIIVQAKLKGYEQQTASLTRSVTAAQTSNALLTTKLTDKEEQCETTQGELDAANAKVKATHKQVAARQAKTAKLIQHLQNASAKNGAVKIKLIAKSKELTNQKTKIAVLARRVEDMTAEHDATKTKLVAANEEVAAKDVVIAHQRLAISEGRQLAVARGDANLVLNCILEKMWSDLKVSEDVR